MKKILVFLAAAVFSLNAIGFARAGVTYSTAGSSYTQDFNSLANTGTNNTWTNNSTLSGWYSNRTTFNAGTGSSNTGALYSFGSTNSTERALGSVASGGTGTVRFGVLFTNSTGITLDSISIRYDGEQWRNGGNTSQHALTFDYRIANTVDISDAGFVVVPQLNFTGPIATASSAALDGNSAANRVEGISHTITGLTWAPGQQLMLRWTDIDDTGTDHGLAIDNFSFSAVPEPSALLLVASVCGLGLARRRR